MKGPSRLVKAQWASPLLLCRTLALVVLLGLVSTTFQAGASNLEWQRYTIPTTGLSVDVPTSIFGEDGELQKETSGASFSRKIAGPI